MWVLYISSPLNQQIQNSPQLMGYPEYFTIKNFSFVVRFTRDKTGTLRFRSPCAKIQWHSSVLSGATCWPSQCCQKKTSRNLHFTWSRRANEVDLNLGEIIGFSLFMHSVQANYLTKIFSRYLLLRAVDHVNRKGAPTTTIYYWLFKLFW